MAVSNAELLKELVCSICRNVDLSEARDDDAEEEAEPDLDFVFIACSHAFHEHCLAGYERGNKIQRWDEDFKCPNCRVTNREAKEIEARRAAEGRQAHMERPIDVDTAALSTSSPAAKELAAPADEVAAAPAAKPAVKGEKASSVFMAMAQKESAMVQCMHCGGDVEWAKALCRGKQEGKFRCSSCHSNINTMQRNGGWPPKVFSGLTDEEKVKFMKHTKGTKDALTREISTISQNFKKESAYWDNGGAFNPLSVYEKEGHDIKQLAANSKEENKKKCPVMG